MVLIYKHQHTEKTLDGFSFMGRTNQDIPLFLNKNRILFIDKYTKPDYNETDHNFRSIFTMTRISDDYCFYIQVEQKETPQNRYNIIIDAVGTDKTKLLKHLEKILDSIDLEQSFTFNGTGFNKTMQLRLEKLCIDWYKKLYH